MEIYDRIECETKVRCLYDQDYSNALRVMRRHGCLMLGKTVEEYRNTYFDTPDCIVLKSGNSFRVRPGDGNRSLSYCYKEHVEQRGAAIVRREMFVKTSSQYPVDLANPFHRRIPAVHRLLRVLSSTGQDSVNDIIRVFAPCLSIELKRMFHYLWNIEWGIGIFIVVDRVCSRRIGGTGLVPANLLFSELEMEVWGNQRAHSIELLNEIQDDLETIGYRTESEAKYSYSIRNLS